MKILRRTLTIAITAALAIAVALAAALFLGILPRQAYLVTSDSMAPQMPTGALVIIDTNADAEPGDVISYAINGQVVTHRLLEINPDGTLVTKGDNMNQVDPFPVTTEDILGKVTTVVPGAGPVLGFLTSPAGIFSGIAVVLGGTVLISLLADRRKDQDNTAQTSNEDDEAPALTNA